MYRVRYVKFLGFYFRVERLEYIKSKYVDKAFYVAEANEEEQEEKLDEVESENEPTLDNEVHCSSYK